MPELVYVDLEEYEKSESWSTITLRNTSKKENIKISKIVSDCFCTTVKLDKYLLLPGETSNLNFMIDTGADIQGRISSSIAIKWDQGGLQSQISKIPIIVNFKNPISIFPREIYVTPKQLTWPYAVVEILLASSETDIISNFQIEFEQSESWIKSEILEQGLSGNNYWTKLKLQVDLSKFKNLEGRNTLPVLLKNKSNGVKHLRGIPILLEADLLNIP
ncbi:MAG: DUF1573 domain-containing protein [Bacteroidota bacterium]